MTETVAQHRIQGMRIHAVTLVHNTGELDEYVFQPSMLNILTGMRNTSKTTTLKAIDYCLGDRGSATDALGSAITDKYQAISIQMSINGESKEFRRILQRPYLGKVFVDDVEIPATAFSDYVLRELGWPMIAIPKGLHAATASELVPLSFRNVLRHIYRNEDSWTTFASQEQEYLRRAVISLLLGFARAKYDNNEFEVARAQRKLTEARAVERDIHEYTDRDVRAICTQLGLPDMPNLAGVVQAKAELEQELAEVRAQRNRLSSEVEGVLEAADAEHTGTPGYDGTLATRYEETSLALRKASDTVVDLERVSTEYSSSLAIVGSELARMDRLIASVDAFDDLPVRICPACEQRVNVDRDHPQDSCYVCLQPVTEDVRRRRAELEKRALLSEATDLEDTMQRTSVDLQQARIREQDLRREHEHLTSLLNEKRASLIAPFMASLEGLAAEIARLEQKVAALPAITNILRRKIDASEDVRTISDQISVLARAAEAEIQSRLKPHDRCAIFADRMNQFLRPYRNRGWVDSAVTVSADDLTFYVGTRPWDQQLGAEARVLFFLAYSYALLFLGSDLDRNSCSPGLLLLDNPFQQGIPVELVQDALAVLANAAQQTGSQIISTQASSVHHGRAAINSIQMPAVYK